MEDGNMKRIAIYTLSTLLLWACTGELSPVTLDRDGEERFELAIDGRIDQVFATRANDGGFCNGDAVGMYMVNYDGATPGALQAEGNQADNAKFTYQESTNKWIPVVPVYYKDGKTHVDIYGYYPYDSSISDVEAYDFEVRRDQRAEGRGGALGGYEASDFLWGLSENVTPSNNVVDILFKHRMSSIRVALTKGEGWAGDAEWQAVSKDVLVNNTVRTAQIDLTDGSVTAVGDVPGTGIVPAENGDDMWRAVVVPQEVAAGKVLLTVTIDGRARTLVKDVAYTYHPGKMNIMTLSVNKDPAASGDGLKVVSEGVVAWENDGVSHDEAAREYVIIHCAEAGKLAEAIAAEGYDLTTIRNLKVEGKIDTRDFDTMREGMTVLESLNLQNVKIEKYSDSGGWTWKEDEIPQQALWEKSTLLRIVFPSSLKSIDIYAFKGTSLSGTIVLPNSLIKLGYGAFDMVTGISRVQFPDNLEIIDDTCFRLTGLSGDLVFPNTLKSIGAGAFYGTGITSVIFPEGLESIGEGAFSECSALSGRLVFPKKITVIPRMCFYHCEHLTGPIKFEGKVEEIGSMAFEFCSIEGSVIIPEGCVSIGPEAFLNNRITSLVLPESLGFIGQNAFLNNQITGTLRFPEELNVIPSRAFANNSNIQGLVFGGQTIAIDDSAFENCYGISSIICNATTPPEIGAGAFTGVPKANFSVEVPEASVVAYQTAAGWREFARITAHRDFTISRRLCRMLGKAETKSLDLRAPSGAAWSVESKPDWVTVSPMSGTGRAKVKITTTKIPAGADARSGEIVFLLDGKDYRTTTTIEQYETYEEGQVVNVFKHSKGRGVDLVFLGDCYDAKDIHDGKYMEDVNLAVEHFFSIEPYKTYKNYFDVNIVVGCSEDSGAGDASLLREARFGTQYTLSEGQAPDLDLCFEYARKAKVRNLDQVHITIVQNAPDREGTSFLYPGGASVSLCPVSTGAYPYDFRGVVQHESGGHGFGKLADENITMNTFIQTCYNLCVPGSHVDEIETMKFYGFYDNVSLTADMHQVPWSHMIFDPFYSNLVDVYEGACHHTRGVYRSEKNSCMNNYIPYYSSISRESIVRRIMRYAGAAFSYEDFKANDHEMYY